MVRMWNIILDEFGMISMNGKGDDYIEFFVRFNPETGEILERRDGEDFYVIRAVQKVSGEWKLGQLKEKCSCVWC